MLGKKMESVKKLAKMVKVIGTGGSNRESSSSPDLEYLLSEFDESPTTTPTGFLAIYVGEERQRFVVPTGYLTHPLFKILLEKSEAEFGFEQKQGLVIPCNTSTFEQVVSVVECCHGQFDIASLVDDFTS